ncbi:winged-helix domain-containing protein [Rhodococcus sp. NPDC057529]|uniref:winged helix-turn-helix transcriptional regulator n=1 Tax=Rhodococcus sp. NPDC057529 TaxID=3346158 RepID=UPI00366D838A
MLVVDPAIDTAALEYLQQPGLAPGEVVAIAVEPHLRHVVAAVEALRRTGYTDAVVAIGQFDHEDDRIAILEAGADYVLDLPLDPRELGAWVRACCRRLGRGRSETEPAGPPEHTDPHGITLTWSDRSIELNGRRTPLTMTEFDIMAVLVRTAGRAVSREYRLMIVWGITSESKTNVLNAYVWSLRRKLAAIGAPSALHTVRGVGFALREN